MKALKWILITVAFLLAVLAALIYFGLSNVNAIVKAITEEAGTEVTGTEVLLDRANIVLTEGRAELWGLSIANPAGFSRGDIFDLGRISVDIDPKSLTNDVLVLQEVVISDVSILAEQKNLVDTNIQALLDNIQRHSPTASKSSSGVSTGNDKNDKDVLLAVEKFVFEKSKIKLVTEEWGDLTLPLPSVKLSNLGSASRGLTPSQLAEQALSPLIEQVKDQVGRELEQRAKDEIADRAEKKLKETLNEKLSDSEKETLDKVKSLFR